MAQSFNLTAQINLQAPSNLKTVVAQIRREFGSVTADVKLNISQQSVRSVDNVKNRLDALNASLVQAKNSTTSLDAALRGLAGSLSGIQANFGKVDNTVAKTTSSVAQTAKSIKVATTEMEEFGKQSALAIRRFAAFSLVTSGVFALINAVQSGFKAFVEFDKELVKLQQVTGRGAIGLQSLEKEITNLASSLGVSSKSLMEVASTLTQAGLSAEDTRVALSALAKTELAPSFDNLTDTTEGAIAAIRQFGLDAKDLEKALGSINAVAAAYAVESKDIIAAIQRTGGVFAASSKGVSEGTDALNEFIAVFTSVRQTTRESAETIATGLRTIFTRIQRAKTIDQLKEYGVELTDLEGKFVGPFEAVKRLSAALNQLDPRDLRFSSIVEELGGFRQIGKVIPLIQQFKVAQEALTVAQKGQGSLYEAQITAQKSLANQLAKVREQFLALIRDIGKSQSFQGLFKVVTGLASGLISLASAFKPILPILAIMGAVKGVSAIRQFGSGFIGGLSRGGGPRGVGTNVGETLSGAKDKEKEEVRQRANTVIAENTSAVRTLTTTITQLISSVNNLGSTINSRASGGSSTFNNGGIVRKFARGGLVPGSGNGDTVPAMLEPGEFVIRKKAVQTLGMDRLHRINKYARGGGVRSETRKKTTVATKPTELPADGPTEFTHLHESITNIPAKLQQWAKQNGIGSISRLYSNMGLDLPRSWNQNWRLPKRDNYGAFSSSMASFILNNDVFKTLKKSGKLWRFTGRSNSVANQVLGDNDKQIRQSLASKLAGSKFFDTDPDVETVLPSILKQAVYDVLQKDTEQAAALIKGFEETSAFKTEGGKYRQKITQSMRDVIPKRWSRKRFGANYSTGGLVNAPLVDDILDNAKGSILPSKVALEKLIQTGYGALDFDRTLKRTTGDAAYAKAKTQQAKDAVLSKYFRDRSTRLSDAKNSRLTQFGKALQEAIKNKQIDPNNLSIISKSSRVPGLAEHINELFGIPEANMVFTSGGSKEPALEAMRTKGPRVNRVFKSFGGIIQKFMAGGTAKDLSSMIPSEILAEAKKYGINVPFTTRDILRKRKTLSSTDSLTKQELLEKISEARTRAIDKAQSDSEIAARRKIAVVGITGERGSNEVKTSGATDPSSGLSVRGVPATLERGTLPPDLAKRVQAKIRAGIERMVKDVAVQLSKASGSIPNLDRKFIRSASSKDIDDIIGPIFEKALGVAGGNYDPLAQSIDFPFGLDSKLAGLLGITPGIMTDVTNKIISNDKVTSGQFDRGRLEARKRFGRSQFSLGGMVQRFAEGGQAEPELYTRGSTRYSIEDMKAAAKRAGISLEELKRLMEERTVNPRTGAESLALEYYDLEKKFGLLSYRPPDTGIFQKAMASRIAKEDRIATWKQQQGIGTGDYEGRSEREKGFLSARKERRGFALGGFVGSNIYDLQKGTGLTDREFNELVYFAKINALNEEQFKEYLSLHLQQKQAKKSLGTDVEALRRSLLGGSTVTSSQMLLAQQLMGAPDAKYNPKYDNARKPFAKGGSVEDTVPALLTPGEFVINKKAAKAIGYSKLARLNQADRIQGYNKGGVVDPQRFFVGGVAEKQVNRAQGSVLKDIKEAEKTLAMIMGGLGKEIRDKILSSLRGIEAVKAGNKTSLGTVVGDQTRGQAVVGQQGGKLTSLMALQIGGPKAQATTETVAHEAGHLADAMLMGGSGFASKTEGTFQFDLIEKIKPQMEAAFRSAGMDAEKIKKYFASNTELFAEFFAKASPEVRAIITSTTDAKKGMQALADHLGDTGYTYAGLEASDIDPSRKAMPQAQAAATVQQSTGLFGKIKSMFNFGKPVSAPPSAGATPPTRSPFPDDLMPLTTSAKVAAKKKKDQENQAYGDNQFFEYRARKEGITSGAFKLNVARRLGQAAYNAKDNFAGRKEEMGYELAGKQDTFAALAASRDAAPGNAEVQDRINQEIEAIAKQMKALKPSIQNAESTAKEMAEAMMSGDLEKAQKKLLAALGSAPDDAEAMSMAMEQMSKELGISKEMLERNFGEGMGAKQVSRQKFIQSREGQRFGALAEFAPDILSKFSGSRAGKAVGGAADFISGKGGKFSQAFARVGGIAGIGTGVAVAADQARQYLPVSMQKDANVQGALGALGGAGGGAASGAMLGAQVAGPVGALIAGIGGAVIGGIDGWFSGKNTQVLSNALDAITKSSGDLDAAFKKLEQTSNKQNFGEAQKAFGNLLASSGKLDNIAFAESPTASGMAQSGLAGAAGGAAIGAALGSFIPILGTALGAAVGAAIGGVGGAYANYRSAPTAQERQEALQGRISVASSQQQAASRLAENKLQSTSTENLDKILKSLESGTATINPIVEQYKESMIAAAGGTKNLSQEKIKSIGVEAQQRAALDAFMKARKEAGATDESIAKEIQANQGKAIEEGTKINNANALLITKQQLLARATKEVAIATENLLDVYRRINANIQRYESELDQTISNMNGMLGNLSGESKVAGVNRQNEQVLGNISAYSADEVKSAANNMAGLLGGSQDAQNLANNASAAKILQDQLPAMLRNVEPGQDPTTVVDDLRDMFKDQNIGSGAIDQILEEIRAKITSNNTSDGKPIGTLIEEIDNNILGKFSQTAQEGANTLKNLAQTYNNTLQKAIDLQNDYNKAILQSNNYLRKAQTIRINAELDLAKTLGNAPTLQEMNSAFDAEVSSLTSGLVAGGDLSQDQASDPLAIAQGIKSATLKNEQIRLNNVQLQNSATNLTDSPEDTRTREELNKKQMDNIALMGKNNVAIEESRQALEKLANDGSKAANALSKIQERQQLGENVRSLGRKLLTSDNSELADFSRQMQTYTKVISGQASSKELGNLQTRRDAFAGLDNLKGLIPDSVARQMDARLQKEMLMANPQGKAILDLELGKDADGNSITMGQSLDMAASGKDPVQERYIAEYKKATDSQVKANEALALLNQDSALLTQETMLKLQDFLDSKFPEIVSRAFSDARRDSQANPKPDVKQEQKPKDNKEKPAQREAKTEKGAEQAARPPINAELAAIQAKREDIRRRQEEQAKAASTTPEPQTAPTPQPRPVVATNIPSQEVSAPKEAQTATKVKASAKDRARWASLMNIPRSQRTAEQNEEVNSLKEPMRQAARERQDAINAKLASTPRGQMLAANKERYLADKKQKRANFLARFRPEVARGFMSDEEQISSAQQQMAEAQAKMVEPELRGQTLDDIAGPSIGTNPQQQEASSLVLNKPPLVRLAQMGLAPRDNRVEGPGKPFETAASNYGGPIPTSVPTQQMSQQAASQPQQANPASGTGYTLSLDETSRQFLDTFSTTLNAFGGYVKELAGITIPDKVTISGNYTVDLKISGAAAIEALDKKIKEVGETFVSATDFTTALNGLRDEVSAATKNAVKSSAARGTTNSSQSG